MIPMIKGLHLCQSLSGTYVENYRKKPVIPYKDPEKLFRQAFEHIFRIDQHLPFEDPRVAGLLKRINPRYVTLEYITKNRRQHEEYLLRGMKYLP